MSLYPFFGIDHFVEGQSLRLLTRIQRVPSLFSRCPDGLRVAYVNDGIEPSDENPNTLGSHFKSKFWCLKKIIKDSFIVLQSISYGDLTIELFQSEIL